ncbi:MAG: TonB-dependent receptor, partial [Cyclobacteriaceae bacterium]
NDSFRASFEYFRNETQDMLLGLPIPPSLGYDVAPVANVGNVENRGIEITAGYSKNSGDFRWSVDGNMSFISNELTSLGIGNTIFGPGFEGDPVSFTEEGQPIAYFYGWEVDGIFQSNEEAQAAPRQNLPDDLADYDPTEHTAAGDIRFRDLNDDGVINADDRTNLGHFLPDFTYGLNATANWKGFDMTLFLQGVSGNQVLNTTIYDLEGMPRLFNAGTRVLDRWTPQNTDTDVPRAITSDPNRNARISSRYIEDGSYMRIKNLTIGYSVPAEVLSSFGNGFISNLRIYASSQNLLTITDYSGYDPEIGVRQGLNPSLATGVDYGQFPQARTFIAGVQIGF